MPGISTKTLRHLRALIATPAPTSSPLSSESRRICPQSLRSSAQRKPQTPPYPPLRTFTSSSARPQSQPPPSSPPPNYYDLFRTTFPSGAPPSSPFTTDVRQLRREFLQLQARAHPDLHSGADKSRAEATSAYINEAYKTLREPLLRAQYLLRLRGVEVANDETAKVGDDDAELLMRVLELREGVEAAESEEEVEAMRGENEERIRESERVLAGCFAEEGRLEEARREAVRLRYWVNVRESLDAWEKGKEVPPLVH